jgi:hypothetical protein
VLAVGPGLGAGDKAAAGDLPEREALLGLAVVVGARRRDLDAVAVGHEDLGGEVLGAVRVGRRGVGGRGDALVAGQVGAGLRVDAAHRALLDDVAGGVVVPLGADAGGGVLGAALDVVGVRGRAAGGADARGERFGLDRMLRADEDAVRVGGGLLEELEAEGLVVAAEVVAARGDRRRGVAVAVAGVRVLGEAAQLAALGVVPAVARVVVRGSSPGVAVALDGVHQDDRGGRRRARPRRARGGVLRGELRRWAVVHGHAVAEAVLLRLQEPWALPGERPVMPGGGPVRLGPQDVDGPAAVDVAQDDDLARPQRQARGVRRPRRRSRPVG